METLEEDLALEGCRSNLARAQSHMAHILLKCQEPFAVPLAAELMRKAERVGKDLDGTMWNSQDPEKAVEDMCRRYGQ